MKASISIALRIVQGSTVSPIATSTTAERRRQEHALALGQRRQPGGHAERHGGPAALGQEQRQGDEADQHEDERRLGEEQSGEEDRRRQDREGGPGHRPAGAAEQLPPDEVEQKRRRAAEQHVQRQAQLHVRAEHVVHQRDQEREAGRPVGCGPAEELCVAVPVGQIAGGDLVEERVVGSRVHAPVDRRPREPQGEGEQADRNQVAGGGGAQPRPSRKPGRQ
jgi:hypothetical protein